MRSIFDSCKEIGFRVYTNNWSRYGKISLICISQKDWCYLFDLISIDKDEKFMELLAKFLCDSSIKKIVHDTEIAMDMLYHQYGIKTKNFFDIEVTLPSENDIKNYLNIFFYKLNSKMASKTIFEKESESKSIDDLIEIFYQENNDNKPCLTIADLDWDQRPLKDLHKYFALRETSHICGLYEMITKKLIEKLQITCEKSTEKIITCANEENARKYYENVKKILIIKELSSFQNVIGLYLIPSRLLLSYRN